MKNETLFTIVIANYNHGKFIKEAISSVLRQSYSNYELFVIDAKSTDNSVSVIKSFDVKLDWWVSEKDSGQSDAFNKGFKRAKGEYLFWLNADDILLPNSLEIAANYILKNPKVNWIAANTVFF
jgi:glycosyltransferase involved in cell wall biosynthesis